MSGLVGSVGRSDAIRAGIGAGLEAAAQRPSGPASSPIERALTGMVARGHGIETLCRYLRLAPSALFDLIITLGLPTPDDRAHRITGARNSWQAEDVSVFIVLWMDGWAAASLAERFGRSRNAVWSKARQLGLPRRERRDQFRPVYPHMAIEASYVQQQSPAARASSDLTLLRAPVDQTAVVPVFRSVPAAQAREATIHPVPALDIPGVTQAQLAAAINLPPITRKGGRGEIVYTPDLDLQIALRHYGSQHYKAAAREMGMSAFAYLTRRKRLELQPMPRGEFVDEFNPKWAAEYMQAHNLRRIECRAYKSRGVEFYFWCKGRAARIFSKTAKKTAWGKDGLYQIEFCY